MSGSTAPQGAVVGARVWALGENGVLQGLRRKSVRVGVEGPAAVEVVGVDGGPRAGVVIDPDVHQPAVGGGSRLSCWRWFRSFAI